MTAETLHGLVTLEAATDANVFGGKAFHLGAARRAGLPVPPGYALSVEAADRVAAGDSAACGPVRALCSVLGPPLAARSSALGEDSDDASYAGQYLSVLNVTNDDALLEAVRRVHTSASSPAVLAYRQKKGIAGAPRIAVVIQKLIDSDCAGVLFTRHPVTGADEYVIEGTWGLGEAVVAGLVTPDHCRLARDGRVLEERLGDKDLAIRRARGGEGGTEEVELDAAQSGVLCLDRAKLARLHTLAQRCEAHFGAGLDLEWAFLGDELFLLQARPISTRADRP